MAGTSEGNKKGAITAKQRYGNDFHKKVGSKSWDDPNRTHKVGFALDPKLAVEAGRKGGMKNKKVENEWTTAEEIAAIAEVDKDSSE